MKKAITVVSALLFLLAGSFCAAQGGKGFEGKISYTISIDGLPPEAAPFMAGSNMEIWCKGDKSRCDMSIGMMSKTTTISNQKTKEVVTLMEMMGKKYMMRSKADEQKKDPKTPMPKITYLNETKTIAGYLCKKAQMTFTGKDGKSETLDVYYTEQFSNYVPQEGYQGLKGLPMEYVIRPEGQQMLMRMTVTAVSKETVADTKFDIPEGYTETTKEEMVKGVKQAGQ